MLSSVQPANGSLSLVPDFSQVLPAPIRRLGLFVDVQNILHAERETGARVDWSALLTDLRKAGSVHPLIAYLADHPGNARRAQFLDNLGFELCAKEIKRSNGRFRADADVDLAVGVVRHAPKLTAAFVVSGDADLLPAWEYAEEVGAKICVLGFYHSTSQLLREKFTFFPLDPWLKPYRQARRFNNHFNPHPFPGEAA